MRIQDIIIGILLFVVTSTVLYTVSVSLFTADSMSETIPLSAEYAITDQQTYNATTGLIQDMADQSPGGVDSQKITGAGTSDIIGLNVMSLILKVPTIGKNILFGTHDAEDNVSEGLLTRFSVDPIWGYTLIAIVILIIAIILISSVLRNRW